MATWAGLGILRERVERGWGIHLLGLLEGKPQAPPPSGLGTRLPITYINSRAQPGPICRPLPHLGSPRQPARARWWLGGVAVRGGPRSPSPNLPPPPTHAPNLLFLILAPSPSPPAPSKKKNQTMLGIGRCWTPRPHPPQASRGPGGVPAPPAPILSPDDSHRCAGGLTAEATGPPLPSASQRESSPAPRGLGETGLPRSKVSGDHAGFRESSCTAAARRSGASRGNRVGRTGEAA